MNRQGICIDCNGITKDKRNNRCRKCEFKHHSKVMKGKIPKNLNLINSNKKGKGNPMWKGGKYIHSSGYLFLLKPEHLFCNSNGYYPEHRLIMEKKIGRILKREERIHHVDENKLNNSPENLMLFKNVSEHMKFHKKMNKGVLYEK